MSQTPATVNELTQTLDGRVAIITGASRGIGKAIAIELGRRGAAVAICARTQEALEAISGELQGMQIPFLAQPCDVRNAGSVADFVNSTLERFNGRLDIVVNNAGIYKTSPVENHPLGLWTEVIETNLTGAMLFCRAVLPAMKSRNFGRIINIASISGRTGEIWASAYSASKFAMIGLTQSLALETARHGITVNAVCPGWVATEMSKQQLEDENWCKLNSMSPESAASNACFAVPQNRFIEPEEVAHLVAYLAHEQARGITGQSINICGGLSLQ